MDNKIRLIYLQEKLEFEKAKESKLVNGDFMSLDEFIQAGMFIPINEEQTYNSVFFVNRSKESGNLIKNSKGNPFHDKLGRFASKNGFSLSEDKLNDIFVSTYDPNHFSRKGRESYQLEAIAKEIGYDKNPTKVSNKEFESNSNDVLYRGVHDNKDEYTGELLKTEEEIINEFYDGPYYAGEGKYGPGIYMSSEKEYSLDSEYSQSGKLIEVKLSKNAKVINIRQEIETKEERQFRESYIDYKTAKSNEYLKKSESEYRRHNDDLGAKYEQIAECYSYLEESTYAALVGYDAVKDSNNEYVVLNRGKLVYK